ncbi:unnamed protein product [Clonostachys rosea f. rosea IK726]|uniref:F-box domain-containing protein n=2 Tax=Bionectria ochroleuca TaxID=29856 RepID=A0A8H7KBN9_BIOOC|nr:unnamed protein product [Clonostachys rosea f. rosea IK726]
MAAPLEILGMIFSHFVETFGQRSDASEATIQEEVLNRRTLASLCRVSKSYNAVATGLLYRQIRLFDGDIRFLTRTILQDRSKAKGKLVKRLSLEFELAGRWEPETLDPERAVRVPAAREEQWDYARCRDEALSVVGLETAATSAADGWECDASELEKLDLKDKFEEDLAAILLFLLPELQSLRIKFDPMTNPFDPEAAGYWRCAMLMQTLRLPYWYYYMNSGQHHSGHGTEEHVKDLVPASLLNLEQLIMCNPFEEPGTIKSTYPPLMWCYLEELHPLWALPKLKSLTLERASWGYDPISFDRPIPSQEYFTKSTSLEHLEILDTSIAPAVLPHLLQCFSSLRSISYELADANSLLNDEYTDRAMTVDMLDSRGIRETIRRCKPDLVSIHVEAVKREDIDEEELATLEGLDEEEETNNE